MRVLLTILALTITACGGDDDTSAVVTPVVEEVEEEEVGTTLMCQDTDRALEFIIDDSLIYWQACYNFRPCVATSDSYMYLPNYYTDDELDEYKTNHCK